ncbi:MAG: hypothetical protein IPM12_12950 [Flavobacteriales bacterium]|nr:hypothetical protein [Flavobacteriales bacterium]
MKTNMRSLRGIGLAVLIGVLGTGPLAAQELVPADGGTAIIGSTTISWSVGEPIIGTSATAGGHMTQGYQQPAGKLIYYSRATGNVSDPIWSRTRTGTAGPAQWGTRSTMVVQNGDVVSNMGTVMTNVVNIEAGGAMVLATGSSLDVHGDSLIIAGAVTAQDGSTVTLERSFGPVTILTTGAPGLFDLTANAPAGVDLVGDLNIRGTLQLNDGAFDASTGLLVLTSDALFTGRLGPVSPTASYLGNMKVERYIPGGATNWRLLGSPISNRRVAHWQDDFITAGYPGSQFPTFDDPVGSGILWPSIRWYDETNTGTAQNDGITGVSSQLQPLATGQGFAAWSGDALGGTAPFIVDVHNAPPHIASSPISCP